MLPIFAQNRLLACAMAVLAGGLGQLLSVVDGGEVDELRFRIEAAVDDLDAERLPNIAAAETSVMDAIDEARVYFGRATDASNFAAWMDYLELDPLSEAIVEGSSVGQRGRAAVSLRSRLIGPEIGLELSRLVRLRDALDLYIAALTFGNPKRGLIRVEQQLRTLEKQLDVPGDESEPTPKDSLASEATPRRLASLSQWTSAQVAEIDRLIGTLDDANHASSVVDFVRSRFSSPNIRVWVDGDVITDAILRPVDQDAAVRDCILGTRLIGTSKLVGQVSARLLPQVGHARLLIRLDGNFRSDARGYSGPVSLDSTGHGDVYVARQLAITQRGLTLGDVVSRVDLRTRIRRINHPLRIVRKIAAKKAQQTKPQADSIARERLQKRVESSFREQTDQAGRRSFPDVDEVMRPWLRRLDIPSPTRTIGSLDDAVYLEAKLQRPLGLAAPGPPPPVRAGLGPMAGRDPELVIQVHETVLANSISRVLSGTTFTPKDLSKLTSAMGISSGTASSDPSGDAAEFEIDFSTVRPIYFEARDGKLRIGIRGERFSGSKGEMDRQLDVSATYRPVMLADRTMMLVRDEEIDLSFGSGRRLTFKQTAIKANVIDGFEKLFPSTLLHRPFRVPSSIALPALAGKSYRVVDVEMTDGWFSVAAAAF